jgi:hypothetical protein
MTGSAKQSKISRRELDCFVAYAPRNDDDSLQDARLLEISAATIFRKQSRHRQSPPSSGIGSRATSSAHQHVSARPQMNSVPQPEQASRRDGGFPDRFVMNRTESCLRFSCRVHVGQRYNLPSNIYVRETPREA